MYVARCSTVRHHSHRLVGGVGWKVFNLHIQHRGESTQPLGANAHGIHFFKQLKTQLFGTRLSAPRLQLMNIYGFHQRFFGQHHRFLRCAAYAYPQDAWRTPAGPHGGYNACDPVDQVVGWIQHGELGFRLAATALCSHLNTQLVTRHHPVVNNRRRVVLGVRAQPVRVLEYRRPQHVFGVVITAPYAFVDHLVNRQLRVPLDIHSNIHIDNDNAGILANRSLANRAHAGVNQHLIQCSLGGRRFLSLVSTAQCPDKIQRVVIGNKLQSVCHTLDQVVLLD